MGKQRAGTCDLCEVGGPSVHGLNCRKGHGSAEGLNALGQAESGHLRTYDVPAGALGFPETRAVCRQLI